MVNTNWNNAPTTPAGLFADQGVRQAFFGGYKHPERRGLFTAADFSLFGDTAPLVNMAANMGVPMLLGMSPEETAISQFNPTQTFYARMKNFQQSQALAEARKIVRPANIDHRVFTGVREMMTGRRATTAEKAVDSRISKFVDDYGIPALQAAGLSPDIIEQFYGRRGSASMFLAEMNGAARFMVDPTTGATGLSGKTMGNMANRIYDQLYGADANINEMHGITARQAGQLIPELRARGMLGRRSTSMSLDEQRLALDSNMSDRGLQQVADSLEASRKLASEGKYDDDAKKLAFKQVKESYRQLKDPTLVKDQKDLESLVGGRELLQTIDADQVASKLKRMSEPIAALKKIYGDNGNPNAPLPELLDTLDKLAMGSINSIDPGKLTRMVRQMESVSQRTGASTQAMAAAGNSIGQVMLQAGFDAPTAGLLGSRLAGRSALGGTVAAEAGLTNMKVYGARSVEEITAKKQSAAAGFARSIDGNNLGTAQRLLDDGLVAQDKQEALRAYLQAARDGVDTFEVNGRRRGLSMSRQEFTQFLQSEAGLSAAASKSAISNTAANAVAFERNADLLNAQDTMQLNSVLKLSGIRPSDAVQQTLDDKTRGAMSEAGIDARSFSDRVSQEVMRAAVDMPEDVRNDEKMRRTFLAEKQTEIEDRILTEQLGADKAAAVRKVRDESRGTSEESVRMRGDTLLQSIEQGLKENTIVGGLPELQAMYSKEVRAKTIVEQAITDNEERNKAKLADLGEDSPITRAVEALKNADKDTNLRDIVNEIFGRTDVDSTISPENRERLVANAEAVRELRSLSIDASAEERQKAINKVMTTGEALDTGLMDYELAAESSAGGRRRDVNRIQSRASKGQKVLGKLIENKFLDDKDTALLDTEFTNASKGREKLLQAEHMTKAMGAEETKLQMDTAEISERVSAEKDRLTTKLGRTATLRDVLSEGRISARDVEKVLNFDTVNKMMNEQHLAQKDATILRDPGELSKIVNSVIKNTSGQDGRAYDAVVSSLVPEEHKRLFLDESGNATAATAFLKEIDRASKPRDRQYTSKELQALEARYAEGKKKTQELFDLHGVTADEQTDFFSETDASLKQIKLRKARSIADDIKQGKIVSEEDALILREVMKSAGGLTEAQAIGVETDGNDKFMRQELARAGGPSRVAESMRKAKAARAEKQGGPKKELAPEVRELYDRATDALEKADKGEELSNKDILAIQHGASLVAGGDREELDAIVRAYQKKEQDFKGGKTSELSKVGWDEKTTSEMQATLAAFNSSLSKAEQKKPSNSTVEKQRRLQDGIAIAKKLDRGESITPEESRILSGSIDMLPTRTAEKLKAQQAALRADAHNRTPMQQRKLQEGINLDKSLADAEKAVEKSRATNRNTSAAGDEPSGGLADMVKIRKEAKNLSTEQSTELIKGLEGVTGDSRLRRDNVQTNLIEELTKAGKLDDLYMGRKSHEALEKMAVAKGLFGEGVSVDKLTREQRDSVTKLLEKDADASEYMQQAKTYSRATHSGNALRGISEEYLGQDLSNKLTLDAVSAAGAASVNQAANSGELHITSGTIKVDIANSTAQFDMTGAKTNQSMRSQTGRTR